MRRQRDISSEGAGRVLICDLVSVKRRGCLAAVLVPLVARGVLVMVPVWRDNRRLDALHERVLDYPLPPHTHHTLMSDDVDFGKPPGANGDMCAYRIRMTIQTLLTAEEIRAYYRKVTIAGVAGGKARIYLWFGDSEDPDGVVSGRVVVEVVDGHGSDWDWRCT
jgi:hypothetical protein